MGIDMRNGHRTFSMGSLDEPVKEDHWPSDHYEKSVSSRKGYVPLGFPYKQKIYPNQFSYKWGTGDALDQEGYGICFICTACNFAKTVVWAHTGLKMSIDKETAAEVGELGGGDRHSGGTHHCGIGLFKYTGNNECIKKFREVCSSLNITIDNFLADLRLTCIKENAIHVLNEYGPFYWSHNPLAYCGIDGSHAILVIGYDNDYAYFKGSWSSNEKKMKHISTQEKLNGLISSQMDMVFMLTIKSC